MRIYGGEFINLAISEKVVAVIIVLQLMIQSLVIWTWNSSQVITIIEYIFVLIQNKTLDGLDSDSIYCTHSSYGWSITLNPLYHIMANISLSDIINDTSLQSKIPIFENITTIYENRTNMKLKKEIKEKIFLNQSMIFSNNFLQQFGDQNVSYQFVNEDDLLKSLTKAKDGQAFTYDLEKIIEVPSNSKVVITAYINWVEFFDITLNSTVQLYGVGPKMANGNGIYYDKGRLDYDEFQQVKQHFNFSLENIADPIRDSDVELYRIPITKASFGLNVVFKFEVFPID